MTITGAPCATGGGDDVGRWVVDADVAGRAEVDGRCDDDGAARDVDGGGGCGEELRIDLDGVGVDDGLVPGAADPAELQAASVSSTQPIAAAAWRVPRPIRPR